MSDPQDNKASQDAARRLLRAMGMEQPTWTELGIRLLGVYFNYILVGIMLTIGYRIVMGF